MNETNVGGGAEMGVCHIAEALGGQDMQELNMGRARGHNHRTHQHKRVWLVNMFPCIVCWAQS